MIEEIDTKGFSEIPDGVHSFRVINVKKNEKVKGMYIWTFSFENDGEGDMVFFGNSMGPLLKVLGCKETEKKDVYILNSDEILGVPFKANVYSEPDKTDPKVMRKKMKDFDEVPF